jgi:hypothetical protein
MADGFYIHPGAISPVQSLSDSGVELPCIPAGDATGSDENEETKEETITEPAALSGSTADADTVPGNITALVPDAVAYLRRPLFASKTNLLYDLALTPNLAFEVPLGLRWSVSGEFLNGWWLNHSDTFCWELASLGLEGRYWFGDRANRRVLTGWFVGAFASSGSYDFQLRRDYGYQGKYIAAGLSAGYAFQFGSSPWSMEFSAGAGFLSSRYTPYTPDRSVSHELWRTGPDMRYTGFIPLKAGISLVYMFSRKVKVHGTKKGGML